MIAHRIETTVAADQTLTLRDLPFKSGSAVEIIILERDASDAVSTVSNEDYPLRGMVLHYDDPTEPVAVEDWEALK